jgi:proliferating cell nuclear antigen
MSDLTTLVATDDAQIQIETTADVIKPIFAYAKELVKEVRIYFDSDGLHYKAVDPANVAMVRMDVPKEAFETYNVDETVIAVHTKEVMQALRAGRKRHADSITFGHENMRLSTTVNRDYDGTEMDLQTNMATIDPDAVRQDPEIPDLDFDATATINCSLFNDAVEAVDDVSDYVRLANNGGDLLIVGDSDVSDARAQVKNVVTGDGADSLFSLDYIKHTMLPAFKTVGIDEFTIEFDEEFPIRATWETELGEATVDGEYFQAPRIQSE